jgi:hypothetical protein
MLLCHKMTAGCDSHLHPHKAGNNILSVVPKYFNFRASTNDSKPKSPAVITQRLIKLMVAMLEAYASDDRRHVDYARIAASEEFRR